MRKDYINAAILWFALTLIGMILAPTFSDIMVPYLASEEGVLIDEALEFLLVMAVPVFTFVVAVLIYSVFRFRDRGEAEVEAPSERSTGTVYMIWLGITSVLAIAILVHPGITGLAEIRGNPTAELEIQVVAEKWNWDFTYPQYGITLRNATELVLPVDMRVKFDVTSTDIIHSFWIPAFRMKIDAVPGLNTVMYVTTTRTGSFEDEGNVRVQCAELCGTGHARMRTSLVILERDEFEDWISTMSQMDMDMNMDDSGGMDMNDSGDMEMDDSGEMEMDDSGEMEMDDSGEMEMDDSDDMEMDNENTSDGGG
jgi:cytochrome c oxidase subunit 2